MPRFVVYRIDEPKIYGEIEARSKREAIQKYVFELNRGERGEPYVQNDYGAVRITDDYEVLRDLIDYLAYDLREASEPEYITRVQKLFGFAIGLEKLWEECAICGRRINPSENRIINNQLPYPNATVCMQCYHKQT